MSLIKVANDLRDATLTEQMHIDLETPYIDEDHVTRVKRVGNVVGGLGGGALGGGLLHAGAGIGMDALSKRKNVPGAISKAVRGTAAAIGMGAGGYAGGKALGALARNQGNKYRDAENQRREEYTNLLLSRSPEEAREYMDNRSQYEESLYEKEVERERLEMERQRMLLDHQQVMAQKEMNNTLATAVVEKSASEYMEGVRKIASAYIEDAHFEKVANEMDEYNEPKWRDRLVGSAQAGGLLGAGAGSTLAMAGSKMVGGKLKPISRGIPGAIGGGMMGGVMGAGAGLSAPITGVRDNVVGNVIGNRPEDADDDARAHRRETVNSAIGGGLTGGALAAGAGAGLAGVSNAINRSRGLINRTPIGKAALRSSVAGMVPGAVFSGGAQMAANRRAAIRGENEENKRLAQEYRAAQQQ